MGRKERRERKREQKLPKPKGRVTGGDFPEVEGGKWCGLYEVICVHSNGEDGKDTKLCATCDLQDSCPKLRDTRDVGCAVWRFDPALERDDATVCFCPVESVCPVEEVIYGGRVP